MKEEIMTKKSELEALAEIEKEKLNLLLSYLESLQENLTKCQKAKCPEGVTLADSKKRITRENSEQLIEHIKFVNTLLALIQKDVQTLMHIAA